MKNTYTLNLEHLNIEQVNLMFAPQEKNLDYVRDFFQVEIIYRNNELFFEMEDEKNAHQVEDVLKYMLSCTLKNKMLSESEIVSACKLSRFQKLDKLESLTKEMVAKTVAGKPIYPKSIGQASLYKAMKEKDIVFALGVAGTGKTYLSVMYAVTMLKKGLVDKIILTRPAVEAGESLGFLPGDMK